MHGESAQTLATDTDKSVSNNRKSRKRIIKIENTEETDQQLLLKTSISEVLEVKEAINNVMVRDESVEKVQQSPNSSDDVRQDESESNKSVVDLLPKDLQTAQMKEQVLQSQAETKEMEDSNGIEDTKCSSDMAACETKDGSASESVKSGPVNNRIGLKVYMSAAGTVLPRTVLLRESERPSDSQLARVREGNTQEFDALHPVKWHIGDLLWGHVSGHPWWPGMVSSDPFSGLFTTIKRGPGLTRMYHVQYFGDEAERGWVNEKSALPFDGKQKLVEYGKEQVRLVKGRANKTKLLQSFCPNPRRKAAWEIAVAESEDAATLDKTERIDKYTFVYEFLPNRKPGVGQKSNVKGGNVSSRGTDRGLKRKSEGDLVIERTTKDLSGSELKFKSSAAVGSFAHVGGQEEGSFRTFCIKHSETFLQEHPDYSSIMVMQDLHQQWTMMSPQQRLRYKSKVSKASSESTDVDGITSGSSKRSPRVSRPSLKKIEADEDNKAFTELTAKRLRRPSHSVHHSRSLESRDSSNEEELLSSREGSGQQHQNGLHLKQNQDSDSSSDMIDSFAAKERMGKPDEDYVLEIFKLNSAGPPKKENICTVCEQAGELIECHGPCQSYFHTSCLKLEKEPEADFRCSECCAGIHSCFACKKQDKEVRRCSVSQCGKFYHEECVKKLPQARMEGKGFICPLHVCATCAADNIRNPKAVKGRLLRCVRCPTAYHVGDFCIAAGSKHLAGYHIVCSGHFKPLKSQAHHVRINVSWCFSCSKGGSLVCCETCPAAFHIECAHLDSMPEDAWYCSDCAHGKRPLYGDIIWIKIGNYRWWPGEICHPRNVPVNIQEKAHQVGEFPVRFFGSHDFYWTHQGRVFLFQEGDRGSKDISACRGLFKMYCKGVKEATEAFKLWKAAKMNKEQLEQERNDRKPAPYKFVKANVPVGNVQIHKADLSEIPRCECRPDQENPCGSDTECLNRMLMYECHPQVCPAKESCHNQRFQKRQYPDLLPYRTESRGWGLKTLMDIKKGQFVIEYVGDLVDEDECKRRIAQAHEENITNFYMLTLDKNRIIDAGPKGNYSRFMNHSCEPNLETQKWTVNGDIRVGLFTLKDIPAGSELTFNYNLECLGNEKTKCSCGSDICSGFLGVRPKTAAAAHMEKRKREKDARKKKKKKKLDVKKEHEDECFRCGEGGELVMCDKPNCPKVYHLQCLNLAKPPHGKWLCPWHHCDVCGKLANKLCSECPNSFCQQHADGVISNINDSLVCAEHTDLIQGFAVSMSGSTSSQSLSSGDSDDTSESKPQYSDSENPPPSPRNVTNESKLDEDKVSISDGRMQAKVDSLFSSGKTVLERDMIAEESQDANIEQSDSGGAGEAVPRIIRAQNQGGTKNVCRTKARYKAQLRTKQLQPSQPVDSSPNPQNPHEDSDGDGDLVIDLHSN
ncbi:hypothetical protein C0Q70_10357 [Pomacea canaliculata]|uniref:Histone-lysine N-methyltransferase n=1 Tax=Pomacea canaliculata TaxID=400727 RepID=A0A2T7PCE1_POMCA|nr:hypothetical protein C0Q70_10357 [Pomacea canaliculata]